MTTLRLDFASLYQAVLDYVTAHQGRIDTSGGKELPYAMTYDYDEGTGTAHPSVELIREVRVADGRLQLLLEEGWQELSEDNPRLNYEKTLIILAGTIESYV